MALPSMGAIRRVANDTKQGVVERKTKLDKWQSENASLRVIVNDVLPGITPRQWLEQGAGMAKKDTSKDDEMLTTQNAEEPTDQELSAAAEVAVGPVPTIESADGDEPDEEPGDDVPEMSDEELGDVPEMDDEEPEDATESNSERVEISPDDVGSVEDVLGIGVAPQTDNVSSVVDIIEDEIGPHAAPDANDGSKAEAMADSRPRTDDDDMKMEASEFITDVPVIRELKAAFKFLAAQLASQAEFEEIQRNFPNIFK